MIFAEVRLRRSSVLPLTSSRRSTVLSKLLLAADTPLGHVVNQQETLWSEIQWVGEIGNVASTHVIMLVTGGILLLFAMLLASKRIRTGADAEGNAHEELGWHFVPVRSADSVRMAVPLLLNEWALPSLVVAVSRIQFKKRSKK